MYDYDRRAKVCGMVMNFRVMLRSFSTLETWARLLRHNEEFAQESCYIYIFVSQALDAYTVSQRSISDM
jgi:hypothetical protein